MDSGSRMRNRRRKSYREGDEIMPHEKVYARYMRYSNTLCGVHTEEMLYLYTQCDLGQLVEIHICIQPALTYQMQ